MRADWLGKGIRSAAGFFSILAFLLVGESAGEKRKNPVRLTVVLDDAGYSVSLIKEVAETGFPLTIAVLPGAEYARECDQIAHQAGLEVMLHLPMEPLDGYEALDKEYSIVTGMTSFEVASSLCNALRDAPHARGVNNHMGSLATQDRVLMEKLMVELKRCGLFFVDSVCVDHSVAGKVAHETGLASARRSVFLDNVNECDAILQQLETLKERGDGAVGIGHVRPETIKALKQRMPSMAEEGVTWVFCSEICKTR